MAIPRVNIGPIGLHTSNADQQDLKEVGAQLRDALASCGFVYLLEHGVEEDLVESIFSVSKKFFGLQVEEKRKCPRHPVTTEGYVEPGREMLDNLKQEKGERAVHELREAFDIVRVGEATSPYPDETLPELRLSFDKMAARLLALVDRLLRALAVALDVDENFFVDCHKKLLQEGNMSKLRSLFYPPISCPVTPGLIRCGEHSDYGTITLLFQDDLGGLEVKGVRSGWIVAQPVARSILVNVGDLMEVFTNGAFPATRHRVVVPEAEAVRAQPRQSFVFFVHPDDDTLVRPLHDREPASHKYAPILARQHTVNQFAQTYKY